MILIKEGLSGKHVVQVHQKQDPKQTLSCIVRSWDSSSIWRVRELWVGMDSKQASELLKIFVFWVWWWLNGCLLWDHLLSYTLVFCVFTMCILYSTVKSDQISCSVVSDSLRLHESKHARPPCPSPTPGVHWDSRPSSQWCHPAISSSVVPFSSCPNPS